MSWRSSRSTFLILLVHETLTFSQPIANLKSPDDQTLSQLPTSFSAIIFFRTGFVKNNIRLIFEVPIEINLAEFFQDNKIISCTRLASSRFNYIEARV